ncbi:Hsp20/alpha crystallin family protein [Natrialbaceae archaeon GCM10025810]|uniref:Hsp20/alpha crystallin family protein n=1 Tax=Halovalidus salilacus TaxID=3075124 RepID=UPI003616467B
MPSSSRSEPQSIPTQLSYDSAVETLSIVLDVSPVGADDVTVSVGPNVVRISFDHDDDVFERVVSPPTDTHVFDGEREAIYNNGVLTVTVETAPKPTQQSA